MHCHIRGSVCSSEVHAHGSGRRERSGVDEKRESHRSLFAILRLEEIWRLIEDQTVKTVDLSEFWKDTHVIGSGFVN